MFNFFSDSSKKAAAKKRRKLKKKKKNAKADLVRRNTIINEARKVHARNKKALKPKDGGASFGGSSISSGANDELAAGVAKKIQMSGKAMDRLKKRQKSVSKSRNTHMAKLMAARSKVAARSRV